MVNKSNRNIIKILVCCLGILMLVGCGSGEGINTEPSSSVEHDVDGKEITGKMAERGGNISCKIDNHEIFAEFEYGKISVESTNNEENGSDASVFEINAEEGHSFYMDFINGGTGVIVICENVAAGSEDHTFYKSDDYGVTWNKLDIEEPSYKMIRSIELLNESEMKLGYNSVEGNGEVDYFDIGI